MQETTVETIVLEEPGPSAHLVLRGVVGAQEATYTDEHLRAATTGDLAIARKLNSQRFVTVDASGLGRLDRTYTARFDTPVITDLPAIRGRARPTPPRAKQNRGRK